MLVLLLLRRLTVVWRILLVDGVCILSVLHTLLHLLYSIYLDGPMLMVSTLSVSVFLYSSVSYCVIVATALVLV